MSDVKVYGTQWCEDTQATMEQLAGLGVDYDYIDVEKDPSAAQFIREMNEGKQVTPTVDIMGHILIEPSEQDLGSTLRSTGLMV